MAVSRNAMAVWYPCKNNEWQGVPRDTALIAFRIKIAFRDTAISRHGHARVAKCDFFGCLLAISKPSRTLKHVLSVIVHLIRNQLSS